MPYTVWISTQKCYSIFCWDFVLTRPLPDPPFLTNIGFIQRRVRIIEKLPVSSASTAPSNFEPKRARTSPPHPNPNTYDFIKSRTEPICPQSTSLNVHAPDFQPNRVWLASMRRCASLQQRGIPYSELKSTVKLTSD
jgi:hypothetical protein